MNKEKNPNRSYHQAYYQKHRVQICQRTLNEYSFHSIERLQAVCQQRISDYYIRYPFETHGEPFIRRQLVRYRIRPNQDRYSDCYDAGMMAYMYSIHRCAYMGCSYVDAYVRKMILIYINCALVIYDEARNICKANGFAEVRLDDPDSYGI